LTNEKLEFIQVHRRPAVSIPAHRFLGGEMAAIPIMEWARKRGASANWTQEIGGITKFNNIKEAFEFTGSPERIRIVTDMGSWDLQVGDWIYVTEDGDITCARDEVFQSQFQKVSDNERV